MKTYSEMAAESQAAADKFRAQAAEWRQMASDWRAQTDSVHSPILRGDIMVRVASLTEAASQNERMAERFEMHAKRQEEAK